MARMRSFKTATAPSATHPVPANKQTLFPRAPESKWSSGKISVAAATVIGVITFAAFLFLAIWYVRREKRARRQRQLHNLAQDPFCPSSLTLAEETSRVLDEFLMKDIEPERTSLMFSRSRSPSMTFVVDSAEARNPTTRFYRTSYEASTNSLSKLDSLTRVSTEGTRPSLMVSEMSQPQSNISTQAPSSSTPRASVCSAGSTSPRSSQLYPTTSATTNTTELSSIFSQVPASSRTSTSAVRSANIPSSANSSMPPPSTDSSRTSSQLSRSSPRRSGGRGPKDGEKVRKGQVRAHRLSQSTVISESKESLAPTESPQLPPIPPTPSPLFRFSEA